MFAQEAIIVYLSYCDASSAGDALLEVFSAAAVMSVACSGRRSV
ncbi:MAG: hypothetical protein ACYTEQ_21475 [Planctomycetota bacterium]|jgi:hypothetical protein